MDKIIEKHYGRVFNGFIVYGEGEVFMNEMKCTKRRKKSFWLILLMIICLNVSIFPDNTEAAVTTSKKAVFTIKTYQDQKTFGHVTAQYKYELPQLKGSSSAVKKINSYLKKGYTASLKDKKVLWDDAKQLQGFHATTPFVCLSSCKATYNARGYVSFYYSEKWYAGGVSNYGHSSMTFDLKTGKKLNVSQVVSGNSAEVKEKIIQKYKEKYYRQYTNGLTTLRGMKISDFNFYLYNGKVIVYFGPYPPGGSHADGELKLVFKGNYDK